MKISLNKQEWEIGEQIGRGGFGVVKLATPEKGEPAVAKFIPKAPGATRELLFVDLGTARNVVPIIDSGETDDSWVLVMPRADQSLRQYIEGSGPVIGANDVVPILTDIVTALADLSGKVVHRDLKPDNVLLLEGHWCVADFGISRYAEATTAPDTQKLAMSPPYAAPERWRNERATIAADIYAAGIIGYELLTGSRPFPGPGIEDYRHQHLHENPAPLTGVDTPLASVIVECLYKAHEARPQPANLLARLQQATVSTPISPGLAQLQAANQDQITRQAEAARSASEAVTEQERRQALFDVATQSLEGIADRLRNTITTAAPAAVVQRDSGPAWSVRLHSAKLQFSGLAPSAHPGGIFDVIACARVAITMPANRMGYTGRSHSLWFCDAQTAGEYGWFETAFMHMALSGRIAAETPFAMDPAGGGAQAVGPGVGVHQVAWRFTRLDETTLDEFVDRWAGWFAQAANGSLNLPTTLPEHDVNGSWRRA